MLLLLFACRSSITVGGDGASGLDSGAAEIPPNAVIASPAFDPLSGATWTWTTSEPVEGPARVESEDGSVLRSAVDPYGWDGLDDRGAPVPTGNYRFVAGPADDAPSASLAVVRAGFVAGWAEDDEGSSARRVALYWHQAGTAQDKTAPFTRIDAIDDADWAGGGEDSGDQAAFPTRIDLPALASDLGAPAEGATEPVAYVAGSRPILTLQLDSRSVLGSPNLAGAELHAIAEGWTVLDDAPLADGGTLTVQRDSALGEGSDGPTVGVTEETLTVQIVAVDAAQQQWPITTLEVPLRVYRLLGTPTWEPKGPSYLPWVAGVDPALRAIEGTPAAREAVLSALVDWVFYDNGLSYDTRYGASAYTVYRRNDWEDADFDMTAFLDRRYGTVVNCTDCAGIMVGFGNMLGALAEYAIIGWNFDLNYILSIGADGYTRCPFGGGGCGFSYHAVTVSDDGASVWDATLALDGDEEPDHTPNELLLVQQIDADEYLDRLSDDAPEYLFQAQGTME